LFYNSGKTIAEAAHCLSQRGGEWQSPEIEAREIAEFRGPF